MAVPEFQKFMLPVLTLMKDKQVHTTNECISYVIDFFKFSKSDMQLLVPSGTQTLIANRVYWSLTYLKKSKLIEFLKRGQYKITNRGLELLATNPEIIDRNLLLQYKEYRVFTNQEADNETKSVSVINDTMTPEENIDLLFNKINNQLADDLLDMIIDNDSYFFEKLVMEVLTKMGYGDVNNNIITKKSRDEGIDGIISQDKLGLDKIYVQAKKWKNDVGRPELQKFVGAFLTKKSNKGIFITTSNFTSDALKYIKSLPHAVILINGRDLTKYMIEYNVGVQVSYLYQLKKIDKDYFDMLKI